MASVTNTFGDNLRRLMGLHKLSAFEFSTLVHISPQTISALTKDGPTPDMRLTTADRISSFFNFTTDQLRHQTFAELLQHVGDRDRFDAVEARIDTERARVREETR